MSLLKNDLSEPMRRVAEHVYSAHFEEDEQLDKEYSPYRRDRMRQDIVYNLSFLQTAVEIDDQQLFANYAEWLFSLMVNLMPDLPTNRIREQMITHYQLIIQAIEKELDSSIIASYTTHLKRAIETTKVVQPKNKERNYAEGKYGFAREAYLNYLLNFDVQKAIEYMTSLYNNPFDLMEIYTEILRPVMVEIGERWHDNELSVDEEHYMTSITQLVVSRFYDVIFDSPKEKGRMLCCSVGSELHEMGARMISDLFEHDGWDSVYLGAGVPLQAISKAIERHKPNLIALSVTMPQHLSICKEIVEHVRSTFPSVKIAVGGRAFTMTDAVNTKWPIDLASNDAKELITWANVTFLETANEDAIACD